MKCLVSLENHCACYNLTSVGVDNAVVNMEIKEVQIDMSFKVDGKSARSIDGASSIVVYGWVNSMDVKKGDVLRRRTFITSTDATRSELNGNKTRVKDEVVDDDEAPKGKGSSKGKKGGKGRGTKSKAKR